jgi:hypothetical protein
VPCTSPQTYSALADGSHTFTVRAIDAAGNTDPNLTSYIWMIDTTPGETTITGGPPAQSKNTAATFTFTSSKPGSTFECKLDGGAWTACTSPKSYSGLLQGSHTFMVRAIDLLGNVDATPAAFSWTVDTIAPDTTISAGPANPTTAVTAMFSFSSSEAGGAFECKLDSGAWTACTSPKSYSGLSIGTHTFRVRATDLAGNTDPTPATFSWTIKQAYSFSGFLAPVSDPPKTNRTKAGSLIPVRFSLGGNYGRDIFAPGYPVSRPIACSALPTTEVEVDESATPGFDLLLYNPLTKRYIYLWKTERSWVGTCRQLVVKFNDGGPEYFANFKFVR